MVIIFNVIFLSRPSISISIELSLINGSYAITFMPRPKANFATVCPILPKPIMPIDLPLSSIPLEYFFFNSSNLVSPISGILRLLSYKKRKALNK